MKYNLSKIMLKAWKVYRKTKNISFAEALHRAWLSAKAEEIKEETNTFAKWKELGYKVQHGASALFGCSLIWGSRGDGATYKASFFGKSQVEAI